MKYEDIKNRVLALLPNSELLNDTVKFNKAINHIQFELTRIEKVSKHVEVAVSKEDLIEAADHRKGEVYHVGKKDGEKHVKKADGAAHKVAAEHAAEIDNAPRPKPIKPKKPNDNHTFKLSPRLLEIMPYGIAAYLLRGDVDAELRYDDMLQSLDPRHAAKAGKPTKPINEPNE